MKKKMIYDYCLVIWLQRNDGRMRIIKNMQIWPLKVHQLFEKNMKEFLVNAEILLAVFFNIILKHGYLSANGRSYFNSFTILFCIE